MADKYFPLGGDPLTLEPFIDLGSNHYARAVALVGSTGAQQGTLASPVNTIARAIRNAGVLHRSAIAAIDKLAIPAQLTGADVATGGSLNFNTTYKYNIAANTVFGPTTCPTAASQTTANDASATHVVRITTVQTPRAVSYDIFLSTDAAPFWVARITEAQRATGCTITAVGTVSATTPGANLVDVRVVGTGVASTAAPFAANNAYDLSPGGVAIPPVDCTGYANAIIQVKLSVTDLRGALTFGLVVLGRDATGTIYTPFVITQPPTPLNGVRQPLASSIVVPVLGVSALIVLVDTLTGQGTAADIYVDLA